MKLSKKVLVAASIAGLMASSASVAFAGSSFPGQDSKKMCGMNGCKGAGSCKGHHACKGGAHSCSGKNGCKGQEAAAKVTDGKLTS